ncbi:MAG: glycosyltransferase [Paludibacter sp.]|nr:glycosyltransferase [Paludibacter sp.]
MILSIIIPVYNVEAYLAECLDSVIIQELTDCEIIIVNDGSTDNSRQILSEYQQRYPALIIFDQVNAGLSDARNTGMKNAKGKYLYFLDSDDYLLPGAVSEILQSVKKVDVEVIGFNALTNGNTVYIPSFKVNNSVKTGINFFVDFYRDNGFYPYYNVWLYVYKKSFLEQNSLIFKKGLYHEDILFSMYIFFYTRKFCGFNILICNYRQHREGSICTNIKEKNLFDRSNICRELNTFFVKEIFFNRYFYNVIFYQYYYNLTLANENNFTYILPIIFGKEDKIIMKKGITCEYEYKLWTLSIINIKLMDKFNKNRLPSFFRRFINITIGILYKIQFSKNNNRV